MFEMKYQITKELQLRLMTTEKEEQPTSRAWKTNNPIPKSLLDHKYVKITDKGTAFVQIPYCDIERSDEIISNFGQAEKFLKKVEDGIARKKAEKIEAEKQKEAEKLAGYMEKIENGLIPLECVAQIQTEEPLRLEGDDKIIVFQYKIKKDIPGLRELVEKRNEIYRENAVTKFREEEALKKVRKQKEAEMAAWIEKHGSDRLRLMSKRGYEHRKTYEEERGEYENPGCEYNRSDRFQYDERANPSEEALEIETRILRTEYKPKIVWLVSDDYCGYEFESCEAIVFHPPWSRYEIVLKV